MSADQQACSVDLSNQALFGGLGPKPSLDLTDEGVRPIRFPISDLALCHPDLVVLLAQLSGVHLKFETEASILTLRFRFAAGDRRSDERSFPPRRPDAMPADQIHLHELLMFDLFVDGAFFARRTNDPVIKGCSVNNIKTPPAAMKQKPILPEDTGASAELRMVALREKIAALPEEERSRDADSITIVFDDLPQGRKKIELYLPEKTPVRLLELRLEGGTGGAPSASPVDDRRPLLVTYGSSITQGMPFSHGASRVWPVVAGRAADVRVANMGVGGQCHFDPVVARYLKDIPADYFVFCLGINIHNFGSMSTRTMIEMAMGFLATVRDGHPATPILVISPIWGGFRETKSWETPIGPAGPAVVPCLADWRVMLKSAVELLKSRGDLNLHYLDGLELMGEDFGPGFPDDLHPDGDGYERLGLRIAEFAFGPRGVLVPGRVPQGTAFMPPERPSRSDFVDWRGQVSGARAAAGEDEGKHTKDASTSGTRRKAPEGSDSPASKAARGA